MKTLKRKDYQRIYNIACSTWKHKLQDLFGAEFALNDTVKIKDSIYKTMRKACTPEQNILFDEIFGADKKELNKWFKDDTHPEWLVYYSENGKRYGFDSDGKWHGSLSKHNPYDDDRNREATKEEIETALIKEAEKRGYVKGAKVKSINDEGYIFTIERFWHLDSWNKVWFNGEKRNGYIFDSGKWAEIIKEEPPKTYKVGQRFKHNDSKEKYILARVEENKVSLICLNDGLNWSEFEEVKNYNKITAEELNKITDSQTEDFTLYKE